MSCISAKVYKNKIEIASDSITMRDDTKTPTTVPKLEAINDMIIGACGYASETGLMFLYAENHKPFNNSIRGIREFFLEFCDWKQNKGECFNTQNEYIIAYQSKCFINIYGDISEVKDYYAIGAGMQYALAALYLGQSPSEAVKVSCALSCRVAEPIIQYSMEK